MKKFEVNCPICKGGIMKITLELTKRGVKADVKKCSDCGCRFDIDELIKKLKQ